MRTRSEPKTRFHPKLRILAIPRRNLRFQNFGLSPGISGEERTLLHPHDDDFGIYSNTNRRMLIPANVCTNKDISISQGSDGSSGIPRYFVQIVNTCIFDCAPSQVHVYCGWFASALLVNPNTFRRLAYDDCLVNGGKPLKYGEIVRFTYANSFMYPIRFKSARFCR